MTGAQRSAGAQQGPRRASGQGLRPKPLPSSLGDVTCAQPPVLTLRMESPTLNHQPHVPKTDILKFAIRCFCLNFPGDFGWNP